MPPMLKQLSDFFTAIIDTPHQTGPTPPSLEVSCAVLLCEVMRADHDNTSDEKKALDSLLSKHFSLSDTQVNSVISLAVELSENSSDFYQFTKVINEEYALDERIKIVDLLWQVAYADGELANIEEHIIRKIADLLHLRHSEYIATKINASERFGEREP